MSLASSAPLLWVFTALCLCVCVSLTAGAQDDIKRVTDMAQRAVTVFGMSPTIGNVSFPTREEIGFGTKPYSDKLAGDIDRVS